MQKLIRITTIPLSLEKLLENQPRYFSSYFDIILVSSNEKKLSKIASEQAVQYFPLELTRKITPIQDLRCLLRLYRFLRREKPLIVHTHTPKAGIIGMLAAYLARVPIRLHTIAGLPLMEAKGLKRSILLAVERLTYWCATKVYPNSSGLLDFVNDRKLAPVEKFKMLGQGSSNGIDTTYFDPKQVSKVQQDALKKELKIKPTDFVFCYVGRLVKDKGINELIKAFVTISQNNSAAKLILVGHTEADLNPLLPETLRNIEFNENIIEVGFQNDVRPYLSISNIFTFPSYREGFPNVILQANAMGIPCIVSDINGCNEIINQGENGLIIPVKNTQILQQKMKSLLEKSIQLKSTKIEIREEIIKNYERKVFCDILLEEYKTLEKNVSDH